MPQYCCVPNCKNSKGGHTFPKDLILRKIWIVAIKRNDQQTGKLWQPGEHDRVCKDHFTNDDYTSTLLGERKRLKKDAVPSLFKFKKSVCPRRKLKRVFEDPVNPVIFENEENEVINEIIIDHSCVDVAVPVDCEPSQNNNVEIQCHLLSDINSKFSIENFCENPGAIKYYSGFNNYNHFMFFFNLLGPVVFDLNYKCSLLEPKDQLFLTLMKLRQAKEDLELSIFFKVSESTVSQLINVWINFLYFQLKEINIWPEKSIVQETMPSNFKSAFPTTRVVLDATEIPISKPQNVDAQSMTFSTYKNKNTLKTIIGCSPRGLVSYISDSYGGSASYIVTDK
ncbi:hypothetical protein SNE40_020834 [Patella caerulea]|uniref:THAP-type domain-containing protein n=1 Tax=Patella caerulea TaxID=87958 RepID=A0AAN8P7W5_PATCE